LFLVSVPVCRDNYCPAIYKSYLAFANDNNPDAVGEQILYMAVDSILYFGLIILAEYHVFEKIYDMLMKIVIGTEVEIQELEDDVLMEKKRISSKIGGTFILIFNFSVLQEAFLL
jgi:hypothetical protein